MFAGGGMISGIAVSIWFIWCFFPASNVVRQHREDLTAVFCIARTVVGPVPDSGRPRQTVVGRKLTTVYTGRAR